MNIIKLREVINNITTLDANDDFGTKECWDKMIEILSEDISSSILYFQNECSDEELYWLSSVFEDVASQTQNNEFILALRNRLLKVTPESYNQEDFLSYHLKNNIDYEEYIRSISNDIDFAEAAIGE